MKFRFLLLFVLIAFSKQMPSLKELYDEGKKSARNAFDLLRMKKGSLKKLSLRERSQTCINSFVPLLKVGPNAGSEKLEEFVRSITNETYMDQVRVMEVFGIVVMRCYNSYQVIGQTDRELNKTDRFAMNALCGGAGKKTREGS